MHSGALFGTYFNGNAQYPTLKLTDAALVAVWKGWDVAVLVLNEKGAVVRMVTRPAQQAATSASGMRVSTVPGTGARRDLPGPGRGQ